MELRYVITSKKFGISVTGSKAVWKKIPRDHHDANVRKYYPGSIFVHGGVAFIFRGKD